MIVLPRSLGGGGEEEEKLSGDLRRDGFTAGFPAVDGPAIAFQCLLMDFEGGCFEIPRCSPKSGSVFDSKS